MDGVVCWALGDMWRCMYRHAYTHVLKHVWSHIQEKYVPACTRNIIWNKSTFLTTPLNQSRVTMNSHLIIAVLLSWDWFKCNWFSLLYHSSNVAISGYNEFMQCSQHVVILPYSVWNIPWYCLRTIFYSNAHRNTFSENKNLDSRNGKPSLRLPCFITLFASF